MSDNGNNDHPSFLTKAETQQLRIMFKAAPHRKWFAVKPCGEAARYVNSKKKADNMAKQLGEQYGVPVRIYRCVS